MKSSAESQHKSNIIDPLRNKVVFHMLRGIPWFAAMQKLKRILREKEKKENSTKQPWNEKKESRKLEERR